MKTISTIFLLLLLTSINCLAQRQADLTKFFKIPDNAAGPISEIDSISKILTNKFIVIANDHKSKTHKEIQSFYEDYKQSDDNIDYNIYPTVIEKEHLTIQFIDYSTKHGWVGQAADSVFNSSTLTVLILLPAVGNNVKGEEVNTICFKMTLEIYSEANMKTEKEYKKEEKIIELLKVNL